MKSRGKRSPFSRAEPPLAKGDSHANPSRAKVRLLYLSFFILDFVLQWISLTINIKDPLFCVNRNSFTIGAFSLSIGRRFNLSWWDFSSSIDKRLHQLRKLFSGRPHQPYWIAPIFPNLSLARPSLMKMISPYSFYRALTHVYSQLLRRFPFKHSHSPNYSN